MFQQSLCINIRRIFFQIIMIIMLCCAFTYCSEATLDIALHLQVNGFGHVHFAVLAVPVKD